MNFKLKFGRNRLLASRILVYLLLSYSFASLMLVDMAPSVYGAGDLVPQGLIGFYNGTVASIPSGWFLCNGSNGTPNLLSKMLYGAGAGEAANGTGGSDTHLHYEAIGGTSHTHTLDTAGAHTHATNISGGHNHGVSMFYYGAIGGGSDISNVGSGGSHIHTVNSAGDHSHTSGTNSSDWAHNHTLLASSSLPPYYSLLVIQASATAQVFSGLILPYSGTLASIPSGWLLCDGSGGTPDLRNEFVRGAAAGSDAGATGGSATHVHTVTYSGNHTHSASTSAGDHSHTFNTYNEYHDHGTQNFQGEGYLTVQAPVSVQFTHTHAATNSIGAHTHTLASSGNHTHTPATASSLPPYYAVLFLKCSSSASIPLNAIMIWVGNVADIPSDYYLCNGTGTPNLQGRFIVGASAGSGSGATGGNAEHNHTDSSSGAHSHTQNAFSTAHQHADTNVVGAHTHGTITVMIAYSTPYALYGQDTSGGDHSHSFTNDTWSHTHTVGSAGAHTHTIYNATSLPAYFKVQFVLRFRVPHIGYTTYDETSNDRNDLAVMYSFWIGFDVNLSGFIFSWNASGSWLNETWTAFSATNNSWANTTKALDYDLGLKISWIVYANSSLGNWNQTATITFTVQATVTFYHTTGGIFRLNGSEIANGTAIVYTASAGINLAGLVLFNYTFLNFTWTYGNTTDNPYNFSVANRTTIFCYFSGAGGGGLIEVFPMDLALGLLIVFGGVAVLFVALILGTRRRKERQIL